MPQQSSTLTPLQLARRVEIGEERRARTRQRLLDAAYRLFAARGADSPTIDDIVAEADVARGTFYNHFDTRDACFNAVADAIATSINDLILPQLERIADPAVRIAQALRLFVHFAVADEARGWILLRTMPLVGPLNKQMKAFVQDEFAGAIEQGRFCAPSTEHAVDLGIGLEIMTIHRLLVERCDHSYVETAAEMALMAFGLKQDEARAIAHAPIDFAEVERAVGGGPVRRRAADERDHPLLQHQPVMTDHDAPAKVLARVRGP